MTEMFLTKNLKFLREGIGLSINELCEKVGIDPLDYYQLENVGIDYRQQGQLYDYMQPLVELCNYFTVTLDAMMLEDVSISEYFDPDTFDLLKREHLHGSPMDRKQFFNAIFENDYVEQDDSEKDAMKMACYTYHKAERTNSKYWLLRKAGKTPRNDFFEF